MGFVGYYKRDLKYYIENVYLKNWVREQYLEFMYNVAEKEKCDIALNLNRIHNTNFGKTSRTKEFKDYAAILRAKLKAGR